MRTIYNITESQHAQLIERKKQEHKIFKEITEEIALKKKTLNEGKQLNEGIVDTLRKYAKQGLLTGALVASLLSQNVSAQDLQAAGVQPQVIQQAMQMTNKSGGAVTNDQIEKTILSIMKRNNLTGTLKQYQQLPPDQKQNILNGIRSNVRTLADLQKYNHMSIGGWENVMRSGNNAIQFANKTTKQIRVTLVDTTASVPMLNNFKFNSYMPNDTDSIRQELQKILNSYSEVTAIKIIASSSTLRNKHDAENLTWQELSNKRAEVLVGILNGMTYDLGGCNVNPKHKIESSMITIDTKGTNGDGTSGPKSPYEVDPEYVRSYQERGIDPKYWQSASQEQALPVDQLDQYNQYQYVTIQIFGKVVQTETSEVPNFRYLTLQVKKNGGSVQQGVEKTSADVGSCQLIGK